MLHHCAYDDLPEDAYARLEEAVRQAEARSSGGAASALCSLPARELDASAARSDALPVWQDASQFVRPWRASQWSSPAHAAAAAATAAASGTIPVVSPVRKVQRTQHQPCVSHTAYQGDSRLTRDQATQQPVQRSTAPFSQQHWQSQPARTTQPQVPQPQHTLYPPTHARTHQAGPPLSWGAQATQHPVPDSQQAHCHTPSHPSQTHAAPQRFSQPDHAPFTTSQLPLASHTVAPQAMPSCPPQQVASSTQQRVKRQQAGPCSVTHTPAVSTTEAQGAEKQAQCPPATAGAPTAAAPRRRALPASLAGTLAVAAEITAPPGVCSKSSASRWSELARKSGQAKACEVIKSAIAKPESGLPPLKLQGPIRYGGTWDEIESLVADIIAAQPTVVGFDMEWRTSIESPLIHFKTGLIQLTYYTSPQAHQNAAKAIMRTSPKDAPASAAAASCDTGGPLGHVPSAPAQRTSGPALHVPVPQPQQQPQQQQAHVHQQRDSSQHQSQWGPVAGPLQQRHSAPVGHVPAADWQGRPAAEWYAHADLGRQTQAPHGHSHSTQEHGQGQHANLHGQGEQTQSHYQSRWSVPRYELQPETQATVPVPQSLTQPHHPTNQHQWHGTSEAQPHMQGQLHVRGSHPACLQQHQGVQPYKQRGPGQQSMHGQGPNQQQGIGQPLQGAQAAQVQQGAQWQQGAQSAQLSTLSMQTLLQGAQATQLPPQHVNQAAQLQQGPQSTHQGVQGVTAECMARSRAQGPIQHQGAGQPLQGPQSTHQGVQGVTAAESVDVVNLLLHIAGLKVLPPLLTRVLTDPCVLKVGLNVSGDAARLKKDFGVEMQGIGELSDLANTKVLRHRAKVTTNVSVNRWSLAGLVAELFHADLPKDKAIRCGNWDLRPLPPAMVRYAALDAYAGLICHVLLTELPTRYTVGRRASAPLHGLRH